jgi:hypothetical protein
MELVLDTVLSEGNDIYTVEESCSVRQPTKRSVRRSRQTRMFLRMNRHQKMRLVFD